jgi:hypothetical protein
MCNLRKKLLHNPNGIHNIFLANVALLHLDVSEIAFEEDETDKPVYWPTWATWIHRLLSWT